MSRRPTDYCDSCDAPRKDANHWLSVLGDLQTPEFSSYDEANLRDTERDKPAEDRKVLRFDYCGAECVSKAFQRWLSTGTIEKQDSTVTEKEK